jgi:hypothetical protein
MKDLLKENASKILKDEIDKSGYTKNQLSKLCGLERKDINKFYDGDFEEIDFLMLVDFCRIIRFSPFALFRQDVKLFEFLNAI